MIIQNNKQAYYFIMVLIFTGYWLLIIMDVLTAFTDNIYNENLITYLFMIINCWMSMADLATHKWDK